MEPRATKPSTYNQYIVRNNELVEKFQEIRTLHKPLNGCVSKSFMELWKVLVKLPHDETNVTLILTSCCNLILSQLLNDNTQLSCTEVVSIAYRTLRKIVWWETSLLHHFSNTSNDLIEEIYFLLERFIEQEDMFHAAGSVLLYLCTIIYLYSMKKSALELVRKVRSKKMPTSKQSYRITTALLIPLCDTAIQKSQAEFNRYTHAIAELITAMGSSSIKSDTNAKVTNMQTRQYITLLKILRTGAHNDAPREICSLTLNELQDATSDNSASSCLSSSLLVIHLPSSIQPPLAIKLLSLSLGQRRQPIPLLLASLAINLVAQLQAANEPSMHKAALLLAERYLFNCATSVNDYFEVGEKMASTFQLITVPSPSWARFKLARILLQEKRYSEAVTMYGDILNSPLWSSAEEKPQFSAVDLSVVLHEYSLALLLSHKLTKLQDFLVLELPSPDFVMLILQAELFLKLRKPDDGIKIMKRAIVAVEFSALDSKSKDLILDVCHAIMEHIALRRCTTEEEMDMSRIAAFNATEGSLSCPSCGATLTDPTNENYRQYSKDLAICHLFHEV